MQDDTANACFGSKFDMFSTKISWSSGALPSISSQHRSQRNVVRKKKDKIMKDNLISSNIVTVDREAPSLGKFKVDRRAMDADLVQPVSASLKTMLGNKQAIAVRVTAG